MEELEDILSDAQKQQLKGMLSPLSNSMFSEGMLAQFLLAKSFVHQSRYVSLSLLWLILVHYNIMCVADQA